MGNLKKFGTVALAVCAGTTGSQFANADVPIKLFTDVSYIYEDSTKSNFFQIHDVDLFIAGNADKHVSYVTEVNFQPSFAGVGPDLERSFIQYTVNPWLKISAGRFHTALGYWNDNFHHGSYLQTSATRPVMTAFEDTGGLLPVHNTGIEVRGNGTVGTGNLGYILNVGNGRGAVKDPPAFFFSYNKSKSLSGVLYYEFDNGLRVGGSFWQSDLPGGSQLADDSTPAATSCPPGPMGTSPLDPNSVAFCGPKGSETIFGAHAVYNSPNIEWLTEYSHMTHSYVEGWSNADGTTNTTMDLIYSQFGYHLGLLTPYARYELNATSSADGYLNANSGHAAQGFTATTSYYVFGARYEITSSSALKLEGTYVKSGAPLFLANMPNLNPPSVMSDWIFNLNWSLVL